MEDLKSQAVKSFKTSKIINLEKGKIPPQAVDLEEAVLGAMMIDKKGVVEVIDLLHPEAFYKEAHQDIFSAIITLFHEAKPTDLLTVSNQLRTHGKLDKIGGDYYLVSLTQKVSSSAHIEYHARIILQKFIQRKLISISSDLIEEAYDETIDVFDLLDDAESKLFEVTQGNFKKTAEPAEVLVRQALDKIQAISNKEGLSGVPSGFSQIDKLTAGWQPSDLIIIAARPGMGKTAFVISMAKNIAITKNIPVAVFSLEMSSVQLITRMISSETNLESSKLRKGNLEKFEWELLQVKVENLSKAPIFIDDQPALSVFDLRAKARRLVSQHGIKLIVIDYLQLMTTGSNKNTGNREQEISTISRNLKALAKELNIPIIALSQLSRQVEARSGHKRPMLSDLRESGAIEQDADIVSFIYRPEYYKFVEWDDDEKTPCQGQAEFIIAKHRNGGLDNIRLKFVDHLAHFTDLDEGFVTVFHSKMNTDSDNISPNRTVNPDDAFEGLDDNVPF
ncbi:MAG: replicative DNA helicase [Flavobacteriaceae bacterium]|nr:replicative DNA helicase [Flavobacteriaceae bacterium]